MHSAYPCLCCHLSLATTLVSLTPALALNERLSSEVGFAGFLSNIHLPRLLHLSPLAAQLVACLLLHRVVF
jgi:hypothetical protein